MKPYTYKLTHKATGIKYYGAQWGENSHPDNIWKTYFTSSSVIRNLIEQYGTDGWDVKVTKIFDNPVDCMAWESSVIKRAGLVENEQWANQAVFNGGHIHVSFTKEIRDKISKTLKGRTLTEEHVSNVIKGLTGLKRTPEQKKYFSELQKAAGGYGPDKHTEETKQTISDKLKGRKFSDEHRARLSKSTRKDQQRRKEAGIDNMAAARESYLKKYTGKPRDPETIAKIKAKCSKRYRAYRDDGSWYWAHRD